MENDISNIEPKELWKIFYDITQIPRPSKHEAKITTFIKDFGISLGLETKVDNVGNIIIKKTPSIGMENREGIILQGHMDMVPQKCAESNHDFKKDPIKPIIDGDWIRADCTTLGADNGIGIAAAMAILQSKNISHGPIEALFTTDEETDMTGANGLESDVLDGKILLNLDTEEEGSLFVGSAGGSSFKAIFNYSNKTVEKESIAFELKVSGLLGGHSGADIHLNRANAIKILSQILWIAFSNCNIDINSINGGSAANVIPREASAIITIKKEEFSKFKELFDKLNKDIIAKFPDEANLNIKYETCDMPKYVLDNETKWGLLSSLYFCPNGVIAMSENIANLVETSNNLAIVETFNNQVIVGCLIRSSVDSARIVVENLLKNIFILSKGDTKIYGEYPGWDPNLDSQILEIMKSTYFEKFGKVPEAKAIHAGLECGVLGGKYPDLDMISFGPTIKDAHTPQEKVNIKSVQKFWELLIETLKNAPIQK